MKLLVNGKTEADWDGQISICSGCNANIAWAIVKASGKRMPVDMDVGATSHFATCPKAKSFRKEKPK